jgi:hypothetical protein
MENLGAAGMVDEHSE